MAADWYNSQSPKPSLSKKLVQARDPQSLSQFEKILAPAAEAGSMMQPWIDSEAKYKEMRLSHDPLGYFAPPADRNLISPS